MLKRSLEVTVASVFPRVTAQGSYCKVFFTQICFFIRPGCLGLIMNSR